MDLNTILKNIAAWESMRKNSKETVAAFEKINQYSFTYPHEQNSETLHVYLGYNTESLNIEIYTIPEEFDNKEHESDLLNNISVSFPTMGYFIAEKISPLEGKKRIEKWENHFAEWITKKTAGEEGLFRAFYMPSDYMTKDKIYDIHFALADADSVTDLEGDLIITHDIDGEISYYNNVSAVPPMRKIDDFYLIHLADQL